VTHGANGRGGTSGLFSGASQPPRWHIDVVTRAARTASARAARTAPARAGSHRPRRPHHAHHGHRLLPHPAPHSRRAAPMSHGGRLFSG